MRLDKYLKVTRLIKRRTIANEACDAGRVFVNGKIKVVFITFVQDKVKFINSFSYCRASY